MPVVSPSSPTIGARHTRAERLALLEPLLARRILLLDGAMGTMIQAYHLGEADWRGERFADWTGELKGNSDLLSLTRPEIIRAIHAAYLDAGADIIETNTFTSNAPAQADYGLAHLVYELSHTGAALARSVADEYEARDPESPRYVAGVLGPSNRTASLSPDVNDPGFRNIGFDELAATYADNVRGLLDGGADLLLIETIFDTLNAKAAIFAVESVFQSLGFRVPVMISGTITDASGRTLSGQTTEAFWNSVAHARPLSIGLNCALGPAALRPYVQELARDRAGAGEHPSQCRAPQRIRPIRRDAREDGGGAPRVRGARAGEPGRRLLRNDAGPHPGVRGRGPRPRAPSSGDSCLTAPAERPGAAHRRPRDAVRERGRADQRHRVAQVREAGPRRGVRQGSGDRAAAGRERRPDARRQHGRGDARLPTGHDDVPPAHGVGARHQPGAGGDRLVQVVGDRGGAQVRPGEERRQLDQPQGGRGGIRPPGHPGAALRRGGDRHGLRRAGSGRHGRAQAGDLPPGLPHPHRASGLPGRGHHLRPEHLRHRHRDRGARRLRARLHRGHPPHQGRAAARAGERRREQCLLRLPGQRPGARGDPRRLPLPRHRGGDGHGHRERRRPPHLRRHSSGSARAGGRCGAESQAGRHRPAAGDRRYGPGPRRRTRRGPLLAGEARCASG